MSDRDRYGDMPETEIQLAMQTARATVAPSRVPVSAEMIKEAVELFDSAGMDTTQQDWESHIQHAPDTYAHQKRVARLSYDLTQYYPDKSSGFPQSLDDRERAIIVCAALHHDLGKLKCDGTMLSGGPLPRKLREMYLQPHVLHSFDILKKKDIAFFNNSLTIFNIENKLNIPLFDETDTQVIDEIATAALYHHEKFNGTGYPYQIAGKEIPLASRILAVADVFDAMRHSRSYKDKIKLKDTLVAMHKDSGKHFDPMALDCLICLKANEDVRVTLMPTSKSVGATTSVPSIGAWPTQQERPAPVRKAENLSDKTRNVELLLLQLG